MPAKECSLFALNFNVRIAGNGLRDSDCRDSIMQLERSRELSRVNNARLSGITVNRFDARFSDLKEGARGIMLLADREVSELSARDRYFSLCHLEGLRTCIVSRLEELSLRCGAMLWSLEFELPDPERLTFVE